MRPANVLDINGKLNEIYFDNETKEYFIYTNGVPTLVDTGTVGPQGPAGTITIGAVTTVEQDKADIRNVGTPENAILDFDLPKGDIGPQGEKGDRSTIQIGNVTQAAAPSVTNVGDEHDAIFDFELVKGDKGDRGEDAIAAIIPKGDWEKDVIYGQSDYVTAADGNAYVCMKNHMSSDDNEPPNNEFWQLIALRGAPGKAATINVGTTTLGKTPKVTNVGDEHDAIFNFEFPETEISQDVGNIIEERADGLYANADTIKISQEPNNITTLETDGIYSTVKIEKETDNIKLKDSLDNVISETKLNYLSLERLDKYLYKATFNYYPAINEDIDFTAGNCTSFIRDNKLYRNFDFKYNNDATFIVKTETFTGTAYIPGLTNNSLDDELLGQLPYHLSDGINNKGIMVAAHLVYNDFGWNGQGVNIVWSMPTHLLNYFNNNEFNVQNLFQIMNTAKNSNKLGEYALQFIVSNGYDTFVAEPRANGYQVQSINANPKLTNFFWQEQEPSAGFLGYQSIINGNRPNGVERFRAINDTVELKELAFTGTYNPSNPFVPGRPWISEVIGMDNTTKDDSPTVLMPILQTAIQEYNNRQRDGKTWQTVHSVVYDILQGMEHLWIQENYDKDYIASSGGIKIPIQPDEPRNTDVWIDTDEDAFFTTDAFETMPVGSIVPFAEDRYLYGYLKCDGSEYSINDYPDLFNVIKYKYGGQNDKFNVPDLRELVLVGSGQNTTQNIVSHDEYEIGEFKDDQFQGHEHYAATNKDGFPARNGGGSYNAGNTTDILEKNGYGAPRYGTTTHGKQFGVAYFIKAVKTYNISLNVNGQDAVPFIKQTVNDEIHKPLEECTNGTAIGTVNTVDSKNGTHWHLTWRLTNYFVRSDDFYINDFELEGYMLFQDSIANTYGRSIRIDKNNDGSFKVTTQNDIGWRLYKVNL